MSWLVFSPEKKKSWYDVTVSHPSNGKAGHPRFRRVTRTRIALGTRSPSFAVSFFITGELRALQYRTGDARQRYDCALKREFK